MVQAGMLSATTREDDSDGNIEPEYGIQHIYAARAISDTFRCWRFRWKLASAMAVVEEMMQDPESPDGVAEDELEGVGIMEGGPADADYLETKP